MKKVISSFVLVFIIFGIGRINCQVIDFNKIDRNNLLDQEYYYAFTEATRYYLFGNYNQAVNLYRECLKIRPKSSAVHYQLSKIYGSIGMNQVAINQAKLAYQFDKNNQWYIKNLGNIYQLNNKYDSALIFYDELYKRNIDDITIIYNIALLNEKIGKNELALTYLNLIDEKIGKSKEVSLSRYRILESEGKHDKAISELKNADRLFIEDYSITGIIAEYYRNIGNHDSAFKYYSKIYPKYKNDAMVSFSYAEFLINYNKKEEALDIIKVIMKDTSYDVMTKATFFYNLLQLKEKPTYDNDFLDSVVEEFYKSNYFDLRAISIYADVEYRVKNYQKSKNALKRIITGDKNNYQAIEQLIYVSNLLNENDSILFYSDLAINQFKNRPVPYLFKGSVFLQRKEYIKSINSLNEGIKFTNDSSLKVEFYSLLAESYQGNKNFEESEDAFNKALIIDGDNLAINNNYAYYLSLREKDLDRAEKMSLRTIKAEPKNPTFIDTYAWILYKRGKVSKAKNYIIKAIELGGNNNKDILLHYIEILLKLKDYKEALKSLNDVKRLLSPEEVQAIEQKINDINTLMK